MDTKPLERFATWARRELISVVDAQASAVLASGSVARSERPDVVRKLESEIGRHGHQQVIDKVAYTWFNRIIALRFMDARGYTDAGVVSPAQGQSHGQPEILADAKHGNLDPDVVTSVRTADAILGLLDGTRRSTDAEGEAYALLLTEYCRFWHKSMPFMFEREGDYTELLVPANLLADGAILSRARDALTGEVCEDVEVIGWLYQFYISERKQEVFDGFRAKGKARQLAGAEQIPAATQLFTPRWIVRYLVENSVGRLWMLNHPRSRLIDRMEFYVTPSGDETDFLEINRPEDLTVIDPACGSGHMLTYAFDLLYAIYEEEGYAPSDIPRIILTHNLYGTEIDPRAGALAAFALTMKARSKDRRFFSRRSNSEGLLQPEICVIETLFFRPDEVDFLTIGRNSGIVDQTFWSQFEQADTLGSLIRPNPSNDTYVEAVLERAKGVNDIIYAGLVDRVLKFIRQAEVLSRRYSVVVANPPYMGSGNMSVGLSEFIERTYPDSASGLDATFMERSLQMLSRGGVAALVTMQSWMFLKSYEQLRRKILAANHIATLAHLGSGVFGSFGGEVVSVAATVFATRPAPVVEGLYLQLDDINEPIATEAALARAISDSTDDRRYQCPSSMFLQVMGSVIAYFASPSLMNFLSKERLSEKVSAGVGTQTGANDRFIRYWFEVGARSLNIEGESGVVGRRWTLTSKGGEFRRWYNTTIHVMDWRDNGRVMSRSSSGAYIRNAVQYFKNCLVWSKVGTKAPSFRFADSRLIHNDASCFITTDGLDLDAVSSYLNSRTIASLMKMFNPTMNLTPGTFLNFPFIEVSGRPGGICREISKWDWDLQEISIDFRQNDLVENAGEDANLQVLVSERLSVYERETARLIHSEEQIESEIRDKIGAEATSEPPLEERSLLINPAYRYGSGREISEYESLATADLIRDVISFAVGCMFGRYSLDQPGLIVADQGGTLQDYLATVPLPTFAPDADNVIPIVDDGWFQDDIVERFRQFLRATFGVEHFEENLRFVEESLGVKTLRDYFITKAGKSKFYDDHVQRYKKRPIYWMFSSSKGSFNALIYMHRYTSSTVSTVLNEYLREYRAKLEVALIDAERAAAGGSAKDQKEADRLRKVLVELAAYEHDVLYPLATRQLPIDLDDGVLINYLRFGRALKDIGLEKDRRKVESWDWPRYPLETAE